jgi:hypothetical protein
LFPTWGKLSLFVICKSRMLFYRLRGNCQVHDCFELLGPNLQQLGGVHSRPTKGIPFSSL